MSPPRKRYHPRCKWCGVLFHTNRSYQVFCKTRCRELYNSARRLREKIPCHRPSYNEGKYECRVCVGREACILYKGMKLKRGEMG